jgi:hypothetical protein
MNDEALFAVDANLSTALPSQYRNLSELLFTFRFRLLENCDGRAGECFVLLSYVEKLRGEFNGLFFRVDMKGGTLGTLVIAKQHCSFSSGLVSKTIVGDAVDQSLDATVG